ncbi:MAG: NfeD family protein [Pseudomonadota bacterium]
MTREDRGGLESVRRHHWSGRALVKYTLLQIPGLAALILVLILIRRWAELSPLLCLGIIALWVVKDIVLFPFVWKAYDTNPSGDPLTMVGQKGVAEELLNPSGYARFRGELWQAEVAEGHPPVVRGTALKVQEMRGLKLIVEKDQKEKDKPDTGPTGKHLTT